MGFDFDGTLAEIAATPQKAALTKQTRSRLVRLSALPDVEVAILSGRALADLKAIVGLRKIFYAGNHGLRIQGPELDWTHPRAKPIDEALAPRLESDLKRFPGAFVERKVFGFALHYRSMAPRLVGSLRRFIRSRVSSIGDGWRLLEGDKTFDLRPNLEWGKGHAMDLIRRSLPGGWLAVFVGDAGSDEEGFHALGPRALTIRIGKTDASAAHYRLPERQLVDPLLELLLKRPRPAGRASARQAK